MKKIIFSAIAAAAISACNFLDENPTTSLTSSYATEASLEADIRGIQYDMNFYTCDYLENLESCSGLVHFGNTSNRVEDNRWKCILTNMTYTSMSLNITLYGNIYKAINDCNILLNHLPDSPVNESYKKEIEAECKMYRAYFYLTAVRLYGDVPLALNSNETNFTAIPRTPYYKVYDQIVSDLKDAFAGMRDAARVCQVTPTQGRSQKWAAKAILSAAYLQMASLLSVAEDDNFYDPSKEGRTPVFESDSIGTDASKAWKLCYDTAVEVIESGQYSLAGKYAELYKWREGYFDARGKDCWNLDERILTIQSERFSTNYSATRSLPTYPPDVESEITWTSVSRAGNVRPSRFFYNEWCRRFEPEPADSVYKQCKDPRIDVALIHTSYIPCNRESSVSVYPTSVDGTSLPYFRKYNTPTYQGTPDVADFYSMRLAEVYYIAAEAAIRSGAGAGKAAQYVNAVRSRSEGTPDWIPSGSDDEMVTDIVWDKLFELCGEGHSYYEVRRLGATWFKTNILDARNHFFDLMGVDGYTYMVSYFGNGDFHYDFVDDMNKVRGALLCEFPKEELTANPAMSLADKNDYTRE